MFDILGSDIVVMQELKIQRKDLRDDMVLLDGWDCYFSLPKHKKGYSGVGIYTRNATCAPVRAEEGLLGVLPSPSGCPYRELEEDQSIGGYPTMAQIDELGVDPAVLDAEGRCLLLEFPAFVLLGVYSPANSNGLRDDFRYGFVCALDRRVRNLVALGKRVVLVGDLNVSRDELDSAGAVDDMRKAGISHEDYISTPNRRIFNQLLVDGEVAGERDRGRETGVLWDTTRLFHPERKGMYTHWEQKINARPGNFGSRIDFVLVSEGMKSWIKDADIQEGLLGSDHCPVFADFHDIIPTTAENSGKGSLTEGMHIVDIMNPPGVFSRGVSKRAWRIQDAPLFSGKRLKEFDKRRSIRSMFAAPSLKASESSQNSTNQNMNNSIGDADGTAQTTDEPHDNTQRHAPDDIPCLPPSEALVPEPPSKKRKTSLTSDGAAPKRQAPETVPSASPSGNARTTPSGQSSLKGFFKPRAKADASVSPSNSTDHSRVNKNRSNRPNETIAPNSTEDAHESVRQKMSHARPNGDKLRLTSPPISERPPEQREQTSQSWSALFARPVAPMCEGHSEPCKTMQTKKKGSNQGRSFWMCARPLGPSGNKERGTEWRCPTFIWCSDWQNGKRDAEKSEMKGDG